MSVVSDTRLVMSQFVDLLATGDFESLDEMVADEFVWRGITGRVRHGNIWPRPGSIPIPLRVEDLIVEGNKAVLRLAFDNTAMDARGALHPRAGATFRTHDIYRVEGGLIVEEWSGHR